MAKKCVHKGCGKVYEDEAEPCVYHPGPPVFHEGQKGWKCCKPRVLTFDEFLAIPPCTTGTHSEVDDTPAEEPKPHAEAPEPTPAHASTVGLTDHTPPASRLPTQAAPTPTRSPAPPAEDEEDDPSLPIPDGATCKRKACNATYDAAKGRGEGVEESCVHHPGAPIFHEGSKGYSCCKRRVLEFDEFMKIEGCVTKDRHLFVGKKKDENAEDIVESVRSDFYQTPTTVIASLFLKKIDKETSTVALRADGVALDLRTADRKRHAADLRFFGPIDPAASSYKIMGTKLELELHKADGQSWPVLRVDDPRTGEIIQTGRAGRVA
ncbi:Cord and Cs domain protein [Lasiodiplodia theobromae]|uniref:Cord and Cs domain protein n=1 Tax=Lasiodiplodia theobromae TaxID=45133 RepID=UPI0015C3821C|nr:Cord and Cs domain protein [Lasiodiplodia theobromae]KAF4534312.1 Cord and Cs domain protein [Lasiodiplodia theobromae]